MSLISDLVEDTWILISVSLFNLLFWLKYYEKNLSLHRYVVEKEEYVNSIFRYSSLKHINIQQVLVSSNMEFSHLNKLFLICDIKIHLSIMHFE